MRTILFSTLLIFSAAQGQNTFEKTIGGSGSDYGTGIQTFDGGYIFAGGTSSYGEGSNDVYVVRTNAWGDVLWTKTLGGSAYEDVQCIIQTSDSGYAMAGATQSFGAGMYDALLIRLDRNGNVMWERTYGGSQNDFAVSLIQTMDGDFLLGGSTASFSAGGDDCYLVKTDGTGNMLWGKTYGGAYQDLISAIVQTPDSNYVACGRCVNTSDLLSNVLLFKTNTNGDTLWTRTFGNSGVDYGYDVSNTSDGGLALAGIYNFEKSIIIKTNATGDSLWTRLFFNGSQDAAYSIRGLTNGNIVFTGWTYQPTNDFDVYLGLLNSSGSLQWINNAGGPDNEQGTSVARTNDGGFLVSVASSSFGAGSSDLLICKTDSLGNFGCNETPVSVALSPSVIEVNSFGMTVGTGGNSSSITMLESSGGNSSALCFTGISSEPDHSSDLTLFPNPANSSSVYIRSDIPYDRYEICDINGRTLISGIPDIDGQIKIPGTAGFYFVKVWSGNLCTISKLVRR